jgi:hypothetical protein
MDGGKVVSGQKMVCGIAGSVLRRSRIYSTAVMMLICLTSVAVFGRAPGHEKDKQDYGTGLIVNIPLPEGEVAQVVTDVTQNGIIRGTKEYNSDEYLTGAVAASSTPLFPQWTDGGKVFYKLRKQALDPRNFKDSGDIGTLVVRYVVQPQGDNNTVLRIDAIFVEDFRHTTHPSNGSVETSEYKDIREHLDAIELMKKQASEAETERQEQLTKKQQLRMSSDIPVVQQSMGESAAVADTSPAPSSQNPSQTLEERVRELRQQVQRLVKAPGAPLKSAPFHTASTLQSLPAGTEVLIVVSTPYWYGVETRDGQHGWILRDQLEQLP